MSEGEVNLSELMKTRKLISKKVEQSANERAKREEEERDTLASNGDVGMSRPIRMTSTALKNIDDDVEKNDEMDSNSISDAVESVRLPHIKRHIIRSAKTNSIKVSPPRPLSTSSVVLNRRGQKRKSVDANGLCNRLRLLMSEREKGISTPQIHQEIDSILNKLYEFEVIL